MTGAVVLLVLIVANLFRLVPRATARHVTGARLKARMVGIFTVLALTPLLIVYSFSIQFLARGIDSWFNVQIEQGLNEALSLSRAVLDLYAAEQLDRTEPMAELRRRNERSQARRAARRAASRERRDRGHHLRRREPHRRRRAPICPPAPRRRGRRTSSSCRCGRAARTSTSSRCRGRRPPGAHRRRHPVARTPTQEARILQALYPVTARLNELGEIVGTTNGEYRKLAYLRRPLKYSFQLTLTLVLLVSALAAVWGAMFFARRLVAPIQDLVAGTRPWPRATSTRGCRCPRATTSASS